MKRLTNLLLEETRIDERERKGEAKIQDLLALGYDFHDVEGDVVMNESVR
jgi:hypothetical protein